jgi:hypothetical protein
LLNFFDSINNEESCILKRLFARAVYAAGLPLSVTENDHMKQFFKRIRPCFHLPSRYELSVPYLQKEYEIIQKKVLKKIREAESLTILTDGWTDVNGIGIMNIMVATPIPLFYRAVDSGTEAHTGEYISEMLGEVIEEVGVPKVEAVVTDNAYNMKSAWAKLKNKYPNLLTYGCMAHGLNLLLKDLFKKITTLSRCAAKSKDVIKFFLNKQLPRQILKEVQLKENNKETALVVSVDTRWGSTVLSLLSLLKKTVMDKRIKKQIDQQTKRYVLDEGNFWCIIEKVCKMTEPLLKMITLLETDTPSMSKIFPLLKSIETKFLTEYGDENVLTFLNKADQKKTIGIFNERKSFFYHEVQLAAYLLDPKEKGLNLNEDENETALNFIVDFAVNHKYKVDKVLQEITEYTSKSGSWGNMNIWNAAEVSEPLTWWRAFFDIKELTKVATRILSLPSTSASCERNFKTFANIKTKKRNLLTIERTNKLVFVKHNLKLLSNEYEEIELEAEASEISEEGSIKASEISGEDSSVGDEDIYGEVELSEDDNSDAIEVDEDVAVGDVDFTEVGETEQSEGRAEGLSGEKKIAMNDTEVFEYLIYDNTIENFED